MARLCYTLGSPAAKVTTDPGEALRTVADGAPAVLVAPSAEALGDVLAGSPDRDAGQVLMAVMVGDPETPSVVGAAQEMAAELWPGERQRRLQSGGVRARAGQRPDKP